MHVRRDCAGQTHQVVAEVRRDLELKADTAGLRASEKVLRQQIGQLQVGQAACDAVVDVRGHPCKPLRQHMLGVCSLWFPALLWLTGGLQVTPPPAPPPPPSLTVLC